MSSENRTRLSTAFLLLIVLTGWIAAPLVHEIEHALERAEMMHVHDVHDDVTLRGGCDPLPTLAEECPISLTKVQVASMSTAPQAVPSEDRSPWLSYESILLSRPSSFRFVRGPPVLI